ncbi:MAG: TIGR02679 family protein, partial [Nitriliruptorales bacterium]
QAPSGRVTRNDPSGAERAAMDRLLGRRPTSGGSLTVRLDDIDRLVREARVCDGLAAAVAALDGPVEDRRAAAAEERAAWDEVFTEGRESLPDEAWAEAWLDGLEGSGLLRRLAGEPRVGRQLLRDAVAVLHALPASGTGVAAFAAAILRDSHALDADRLVTTLVAKALQHRLGGTEEPGPIPTGEDLRALWASAGVLHDELVAPVLAVNLPTGGHGLTDLVLTQHTQAGEPVRLTLRQLVRHPPALEVDGRRVFVCENPAVVSAATDELGCGCAPLVCVEGQPASAAQTLLRQLAAAGAELLYHGDFDWPGIRIASRVIARVGARPWRLGAADYEAAPPGPPLSGPAAETPWDPALSAAMAARGVAVHEEQVLGALLGDLAFTPST